MIPFVKMTAWGAVLIIGFLAPLWVFVPIVIVAALIVPVATLLPIALVLDAYGVSSGAVIVPWHILIVGVATVIALPLRGRLRGV